MKSVRDGNYMGYPLFFVVGMWGYGGYELRGHKLINLRLHSFYLKFKSFIFYQKENVESCC